MWGNYSGFATRTITAMEGIQQFAPQAKFISGCGLTRNEAFESRFDELKTPLGNKGMQATYYNNTEMKGSPAATTDFTAPIMLSNGGNTVFAPGVNLEHFSARLDATFTPTRDTRDETVIFNINGDDKVRLLVNGDTIVDIWRVRQRIQGAQKEIAVKAGQQYRTAYSGCPKRDRRQGRTAISHSDRLCTGEWLCLLRFRHPAQGSPHLSGTTGTDRRCRNRDLRGWNLTQTGRRRDARR